MAYSLNDVLANLTSDLPRSYVEAVADIEQQTYAPSRNPSVKRDWPSNGKHVGLIQMAPGLALDSGAIRFTADERNRIMQNVRTGAPIPDIVAKIKALDSAAVQAKALDFTWEKVKKKTTSKADFYFYHNQGIYAKKVSRHQQSRAAAQLLALRGN